MVENVKKVVLPNGLRILLIPRPGVESVLVEVMVAAGSRHETPANAGVAHLLEHLSHKGTPRWPIESQLDDALNVHGADFNAEVGYDETTYYVHLIADLLPLAVEWLGEVVLRPLFRPEDIATEREVVLEELRGDLDDPSAIADDLMRGLVYPGMGLGRPIPGTEKSVSALRRSQVLEFRARHYRPETTVITVVGKFDESQILALIERSFGTWFRLSSRRPRVDQPARAPRGPMISTRTDQALKQAYVAIGFRTPGIGHSLRRARAVLNLVLGGDTSSRFFVNVRGRRGLVYEIDSGVEIYRGAGSWEITAALSRRRLSEALVLIIEELVRLKSDGITPEELARAKSCVRGQTALGSESLGHFSSFYGNSELHDPPFISQADYLDSISALTLEEVRQVACETFRASNLNLALVAPRYDRRELRRIIAKLGD